MNSWKADGSVNSPWLHAEATAPIRRAVALRLRLLPYLYTQLWRAAREHLPVLRPTFFDFGDDPETWHDSDEMMVGPDLLAAPVFEPGARTRRLYLPRHDGGWYDWTQGKHHAGGQWITVDAALDHLPLFVRGGAVVPVTDSVDDHARTEEPTRALRVFPGADGPSTGMLYEDDGLQNAGTPDRQRVITGTLLADASRLQLSLHGQGAWPLPYRSVRVVLPPGERRPLSVVSRMSDVSLDAG
jgi:alpha-glucosidase